MQQHLHHIQHNHFMLGYVAQQRCKVATGCLAGVAAVEVEQANTVLALLRVNAQSTVLGNLTLADAGNKFIEFLAAVGFKASHCSRLQVCVQQDGLQSEMNTTSTAGSMPDHDTQFI